MVEDEIVEKSLIEEILVMTEIRLEDIKKIELHLLLKFHDVCCSNGFTYSLCGGSLLGAVRHKGFIPWDDDVDVLMPQPDFNAFIRYCSSNYVPFGFLHHSTNKKMYDGFGKVYDDSTIIIDETTDYQGMGLGIHIDICPIVGLADTYENAIKMYRKTSIQREMLVAKNWNHYVRSKTRAWYYEPIRFTLFAMSRIISGDMLIESIDSTYSNIEYETAKFGGCVYGSYREKEIMSMDAFREYMLLPFEDKEFYCIKNFDIYLRKIYGDYMKLPPESKRVPHHYFRAYYKNN